MGAARRLTRRATLTTLEAGISDDRSSRGLTPGVVPGMTTDSNPSAGDTPLSSVTNTIDDEHGTGQFGVLEHAELRCFTCRETFPASTVPADRLTRLEGASDPSDMVVVIPVTCPHCSTSGSLVLNYGAEASVDEADALDAMERRPEVGTPGTNPTPGIQH